MTLDSPDSLRGAESPRSTIHIFHLIGIACLLTVFLLLINPFRGVLLGDDSIYVRTVQRLSEQGVFRLSPAIAGGLVFQVFWGWLFTVPFGFSISALLASVPPLALIGLIAFYRTIMAMRQSASVALLGTVAVLASPLYIRLLASFMMDVPFVSLTFIAVYFYIKALQSGGKYHFFLGSVAVSCALLIRQIGLGIAIAIFVALMYRALLTKRIPWGFLVSALLSPSLTFVGYEFWLNVFNGVTWAQKYIVGHGTTNYIWHWQFPLHLAHDVARYAVFLMLLLVPCFAMRVQFFIQYMKKAITTHPLQIGGLVGAALLVDHLFSSPSTPPFWLVGMLYWMGLKFVAGVWIPVALLLLIVAAVVARRTFVQILRRVIHRSLNLDIVFIVTLILFFLITASLLPAAYRTDRYLLPIFPLVGLLWLRQGGKQPINRCLPIMLFVLSSLLGIWMTRFNYDVAAVQWREADRLVASGVQREHIRGNWGWEGWHFWDPCLERMISEERETEAQLDCWQTNAPTAYRIKLYSVLGQQMKDLDEHYAVEKFIPLSTFLVPAKVAVMVNHALLPPRSGEN